MSIASRVRALSPDQRRALAERIAAPDHSSRRLIAYCVGEARPDAELREHLRSTLPEFMIPARFVWLDGLPRLPNGKVDRVALPTPTRDVSQADPPARPMNDVATRLAGIWAGVLGVPAVGLNQNFFELGGDSLLSLRVVARARECGVQVTPTQIFQHPTIEALARVATESSDVGVTESASSPREASPRSPAELVPLTAIQRWFFDLRSDKPHHWNLPLAVELAEPIDAAEFAVAARAIAARHDAFRLRFGAGDDGEWQQWMARDEGVAISTVDLSGHGDAEQDAAMDALGLALAGSLNITVGPVAHFVAIDMGERPARLWIIAHHLVADGVSLRSLLDEFQMAYGSDDPGRELGAPAAEFSAWATATAAAARRGDSDSDAAFWLRWEDVAIESLPRDEAVGFGLERDTRRVRVALDEGSTRSLLTEAHAAYNTCVDDLLRTALLRVVSEWSGQRSLWLDCEGHGRGGDATDAVGWMTALAPVFLCPSASGALGDDLLAVKEIRRSVPRGGVSFGLLRYLRDDDTARRLARLPRPEIYINYLGQFDQVLAGSFYLGIADDSMRLARHPESPRTHLLEVNAWVVGGRLQVEWAHGPAHSDETVYHLAESFRAQLDALIAHCLLPDAGGHSPSDFPDADLNQEELDDLLDSLGDDGP